MTVVQLIRECQQRRRKGDPLLPFTRAALEARLRELIARDERDPVEFADPKAADEQSPETH